MWLGQNFIIYCILADFKSNKAMSDKIKAFYNKVPVWKQIYYKWRSLKGVPFRKKYFVGYDLDANTYWEFYLERQQARPRRIVEPYEPQKLLFNYFDKVPIQWAQWLKYARRTPPSIFDIIADEERIKKLQVLSQFRDSEQLYNKELKQQKIDYNLQKELSKLEAEKAERAENAAKIVQRAGVDASSLAKNQDIKTKPGVKLHSDNEVSDDPWKKADQHSTEQPEESTINPIRRK